MKFTHLNYRYLIFFAFLLASTGCNNSKKKDVPDIRSYDASKTCDEIIYSTNIDEIYRLWLLKGAFRSETVTNTPLKMDSHLEVFPSGISCDCNTIGMFGLDKDQHVRASMYTYNLKSKESVDLNKYFKTRVVEFAFSPTSSKAAILDSNKNLRIYDYKNFKEYYKPQPKTDHKFSSITWSPKGRYIYLTDDSTSIWRMRLSDNSFLKIWQAPVKSKESRSITGDAKNDEIFYFRSEHESEFLQIYKYDPESGAKRLFTSNYDQNLSGAPVQNDSLFIKTYRNNYVDQQLFIHGQIQDLITQRGVVFDYYPAPNELLMYSDDTHPYSVYRRKGYEFVSMIDGIMDTMPQPKMIRNKSGAYNMVFFPTSAVKKWVVYLHGGPRQQVFQKHDKFISYFLKSGIGVIVLNYPGSTGFGKKYQINEDTSKMVTEVRAIHNDLGQIREQFKIGDQFGIIGISYSAMLAHLYTLNYKDADKVIDLSGIGDIPVKQGTQILYVYGNNDFALDSKARIKMIKNDLKTGYGKSFTVDGEGHVIAHRTSTLAIMKHMADFLAGN